MPVLNIANTKKTVGGEATDEHLVGGGEDTFKLRQLQNLKISTLLNLTHSTIFIITQKDNPKTKRFAESIKMEAEDPQLASFGEVFHHGFDSYEAPLFEIAKHKTEGKDDKGSLPEEDEYNRGAGKRIFAELKVPTIVNCGDEDDEIDDDGDDELIVWSELVWSDILEPLKTYQTEPVLEGIKDKRTEEQRIQDKEDIGLQGKEAEYEDKKNNKMERIGVKNLKINNINNNKKKDSKNNKEKEEKENNNSIKEQLQPTIQEA
ncbi:hypothetical protein BY996DRAFT_6624352 [Phakopsora pachyrhizi]|nr:hypothetical protein BY996DRAFT_6624352 [Phakopsora pachyrhizi]